MRIIFNALPLLTHVLMLKHSSALLDSNLYQTLTLHLHNNLMQKIPLSNQLWAMRFYIRDSCSHSVNSTVASTSVSVRVRQCTFSADFRSHQTIRHTTVPVLSILLELTYLFVDTCYRWILLKRHPKIIAGRHDLHRVTTWAKCINNFTNQCKDNWNRGTRFVIWWPRTGLCSLSRVPYNN